jgi:hypothetical protein
MNKSANTKYCILEGSVEKKVERRVSLILALFHSYTNYKPEK